MTEMVPYEIAEKARDAAYQQGRKDAMEEAQQVRNARWSMDLEKVDTVQSRAQIEALRAIAEELHEVNAYLTGGKAVEDLNTAVMNAPVPKL